MYEVTLNKLSSTHKLLRTDEILGQSNGLPVVGERYVMVGDGLTFGTRLVSTSPVQEVFQESDNALTFRTENSVYHLEYEEVHNLPEE